MKYEFKKIKVGEFFGLLWIFYWFKLVFIVLKEFEDEELVELNWDSNSEVLMYIEDGIVIYVFIGGGECSEWIIFGEYCDGGEYIIYIEMVCNFMFGNVFLGISIVVLDENCYFRFDYVDIVVVNVQVCKLYFDMWEFGDVVCELFENFVEQN